ncbi:hypothetical protein [Muricoccus vinaceus]|uniref:Glycosyltransferase RgtA/B/C/D-like domain-containing protein n=1 Tax=Muricoccus vinaceus TaxID=424704 RepID=A0ABV6IRQ4_9PROT
MTARTLHAFPFVAIAIPVLLGLMLAIGYADANAGLGETGRAAVSLLNTGLLGNPYLIPTGPTAHVSPVHTGYLAAVFLLLGEYTHAARIALSVVCTALWAASTYYVLRIGQILRFGRPGMAVAILLTCLVPVYLSESVVDCRQWDQPFSAFLLIYALYRVLGREADGSLRATVAAAVLAGVGTLLSPALLPPMLFALWFALPRRQGYRPAFLAILVAASIMAAFLVPWGIRNAGQIGAFTMTRSNFWLEMAVGNNEQSRGDSGSSNLDAIHPFTSEPSARTIARAGEIEFMGLMRERALAWISEHPLSFAGLSLARAVLVFFPTQGMIPWVPVLGTALAWYYYAAFGAAKLLSLLVVAAKDRNRLVWLAFTLLPLAPYTLTHVNVRYLFVVFFPSACLIAFVADQAWVRLAGALRTAPGAPPGVPSNSGSALPEATDQHRSSPTALRRAPERRRDLVPEER